MVLLYHGKPLPLGGETPLTPIDPDGLCFKPPSRPSESPTRARPRSLHSALLCVCNPSRSEREIALGSKANPPSFAPYGRGCWPFKSRGGKMGPMRSFRSLSPSPFFDRQWRRVEIEGEVSRKQAWPWAALIVIGCLHSAEYIYMLVSPILAFSHRFFKRGFDKKWLRRC